MLSQRHTAGFLVLLALTACGGSQQSDSSAATAQAEIGDTPGANSATPSSINNDISSTEKIATAAEAENVNILPISTSATEMVRGSIEVATQGYHVDQTKGDDSNDGSRERPWKTLARLKTVKLKADEGIFLACGSKWRESLVLDHTQLVDGSTISWYGSNCSESTKPVISGADILSGTWRKNGSVWSLPLPANTPKITQLFIQRQALRTAQWPNSQSTGTQVNSSPTGTSSIRLSQNVEEQNQLAISSRDFVNATVQIQTEPWLIESRTIQRQQGSELSLDRNTDHAIDAGDRLVFQDKAWMLDEPGEFFHDTAAGVIHLMPPQSLASADLNQTVVEGSTRVVALLVSGRKNLKISRIAAEMASTDGITVNHAPSAIIEAVESSLNRWSGIRINQPTLAQSETRSVFVMGGKFLMNKLSGVDTGNAVRSTIINNTVLDTGLNQAEWSHAGIIGGSGALIIGNKVENSAFRGIEFSGSSDSQLVGNLVKKSCLSLSDCGGLYTVMSAKPSGLTSRTLVSNNIIDDSAVSSGAADRKAVLAGIYIDDYSSNVLIQNNTVISSEVGIYLHNSSNSVVENNSIWRSRNVGILAVMDRTHSNDMTGNVFQMNELVYVPTVYGESQQLPSIQKGVAIRFLHAIQGEASILQKENIFSGNKFHYLFDSFETVAETGRTGVEFLHSRKKWLQLSGDSSILNAAPVAPIWSYNLGPELIPNGGLEQGMTGWSFWNLFPSAMYGAVLHASVPGCQGLCTSFTASSPGDHLSTPRFQVKAGALYRVRLTATPQSGAEISHPNVARPGPPYESFVSQPGIATALKSLTASAGEQIVYEGIFQSNATAEATMNLRINTPSSAVRFDSVSLRQITGYKANPFQEWGATLYADPTQSRSVTCQSLAGRDACRVTDIAGNPVSMPFVLEPGSARFLLWSDAAAKP
jgi:parallel beta-helix repeat protein